MSNGESVDAGKAMTDVTRDPILLYTLKPPHFVKVNVCKLGLFNHFIIEPSFELHHEQ